MSHDQATQKKVISDIIMNQDNMYATCYIESDAGKYGHMTLRVRLAAAKNYSWRPDLEIMVASQIGGSCDATANRIYAIKWGMHSAFRGTPASLVEVECAAKLMRKIQRKLDALADQGEYVQDDMAKLCWVILRTVGVKHLLIPHAFWNGSSSDITDWQLLDAQSLDAARAIEDAQRTLVECFRRIAA